MKFKFMRIELQLTQYELAFATGIPRWKIQLIEQGVYAPTDKEIALLEVILSKKNEGCYER